MEELIPLLVIEEKSADGETHFTFEPQPVKKIYAGRPYGKPTHSFYLMSVKKGTTVSFTRLKNGNIVKTKTFIINEPTFIDNMGTAFPMPKHWIAYAKMRKLV